MPVAVIDAVNTATPVTYYVHTDHLMRPLKMTNAAGAVAWDVVWKPFGETFSITAAPKLDLGFPGQWTQSENGLAWNWHRHYDPTTGRYTKPDPLRFVDGPGLYAYVGGNPLTKIDPSGLSLTVEPSIPYPSRKSPGLKFVIRKMTASGFALTFRCQREILDLDFGDANEHACLGAIPAFQNGISYFSDVAARRVS
ncbi:MAG: hypothetical protein HZY79_08195 [Rhodoblastus sp.]|nr:MAG: hypothetical protein HZY79_08195 [Rhodoblastus sp.]